MNALSNNLRAHLPNWLTWSNLRFQWTVMALFSIVISALVGFATMVFSHKGPDQVVILIALMSPSWFAVFHFGEAAIRNPSPGSEPWMVNRYEALKSWWRKNGPLRRFA